MLKKTSSSEGGRGSVSSSNGGRVSSSSLLRSPRSLSSPVSLFSMDAADSVLEHPPDGSSVRSNARSCGAVTGLAAVLVAGEAERAHLGNGRVQLPSTNGGGGGGDILSSPIEFGVKNRDSQLALLSPVQRSPLSSAARNEVELDEDYTCVIDRRPNPRMIHIFDDRAVESRCSGDHCQLRSCYCSTETTKHSAATNAGTGTCFTIKGSIVHRTRRQN